MHVSRPEFHQVFSLHPVTVTDVAAFLEGAERGDNALGARALELLRRGDSRGPDQLGEALTTFLADRHPIFVLTEISLTNWEAQIDRGIGMMMRPPARLFIDAGMERPLAQQMSIRLDHNAGSMAGAFVPAHLVGQFDGMLEERLQRHLRRLREAELDPIANVGLLLQAVAFAKSNGTGLIEATGVVDALDPGRRWFLRIGTDCRRISARAWRRRPSLRRSLVSSPGCSAGGPNRAPTAQNIAFRPQTIPRSENLLGIANFPVGNRVGRPCDLDTVRVKLLSFFALALFAREC